MPDRPVPPDAIQRGPIGRRRYVTVLFSDVSNSSQHAEALEAEAYAGLLEQFRHYGAFGREINRYATPRGSAHQAARDMVVSRCQATSPRIT